MPGPPLAGMRISAVDIVFFGRRVVPSKNQLPASSLSASVDEDFVGIVATTVGVHARCRREHGRRNKGRTSGGCSLTLTIELFYSVWTHSPSTTSSQRCQNINPLPHRSRIVKPSVLKRDCAIFVKRYFFGGERFSSERSLNDWRWGWEQPPTCTFLSRTRFVCVRFGKTKRFERNLSEAKHRILFTEWKCI